MPHQAPREENSFLFGSKQQEGGWLFTPSSGKGLDDMIGTGSSSYTKKSKYQRSGLEDMF